MKPRFPLFALAGLLTATCTLTTFANEKEKNPGEQKHAEKPVVATIRPAGKPKPADLPALAKITFEQALKAALAAVPGSALKGELEVEEGNLVYSFEILNAQKKVMEVEIDAGTGKVLDIDED